MQIAAASSSLNLHSGKSFVKKITLFIYFFAIYIKPPCEIEKFELEVVSVDILRTEFCF